MYGACPGMRLTRLLISLFAQRVSKGTVCRAGKYKDKKALV